MKLNEFQELAVEHVDGPCLVTSCPGSGKTRVLVERVIRLLERGINPKSIICITFTNKAANEMKKRICKRLGVNKTSFFVGTFHALCVSLLRKIGTKGGYATNFNILDENDQLDLILQVARRRGSDITRPDASNIKYFLNLYRDSLKDISNIDEDLDHLAGIARDYLRVAKENNLIDFTGLIYETINILEDNEDIREKVQNHFKYILVDEMQDTNLSQYHLIKLMGDKWKNIMLIGDIDQSVYRWRNARYENIQEFLSYYPKVRVITLSKNYRSTPQIIKAAGDLIKNNDSHILNQFETDNADGASVKCSELENQTLEARWVASRIESLKVQGGWDYEDFAILYRVNKMSEPLEQVFSTRGMPYEVVGGFSFYDRKEVKDCLAMLKYLVNRKDGVAFHRICSLVKGMGNITIGNIENVAISEGCTLDEACLKVKESSRSRRIGNACKKIYDIYNLLYDQTKTAQCMSTLVREFDMEGILREKYGEEYLDRMENVSQVIEAVGEFDGLDKGVEKYLQQISLVSNADKEVDGNKISLMSLHAAKGLEFPIVFIVGVEENILPHIRSIKGESASPENLEEERRLCYVGMTRAKKLLQMSWCSKRRSYGKYKNVYFKTCLPSIFLKEAGLIDNYSHTVSF